MNQTKQKLLILGAGQYGFVAKDVAEAMGCFEKIEFLDDEKDFAIGKLDEAPKFASSFAAIVAIGNSRLRMEWLEKLKTLSFSIATLVHPTAVISPGAILEEGVIAEPMCVVHHESYVKKGVILSAGSVIDHNSTVGEGCHIGCGATVESRAVVPPHTKVENSQAFKRSL